MLSAALIDREECGTRWSGRNEALPGRSKIRRGDWTDKQL